MHEIWKDAIGFDGVYQVSSLGRVRSCDRVIYYKNSKLSGAKSKIEHGKIMSQCISNSGYYILRLRKDGERKCFYTHRLIAQAFIPNPENKSQVNHIDGNRLNNCVDNLEWVTMSENVLHAYRTGLNYGLRGDLSPHKVEVLQFEKDGTFVMRWSCMAEAARAIGGCKEGIYDVCKGRLGKKTYKGYVWKYADAVEK